MRRPFPKPVVLFVLCFLSFLLGALAQTTTRNPITRMMVLQAEKLIGLAFRDRDRALMLDGLKEQLGNYENIRKVELLNDVPPALVFHPVPEGMELETVRKPFRTGSLESLTRPANLEDLAFCSVGQLADLIKSKQVTSEELTRMYLGRLKKYGPKLECVIALTEALALEQARRADQEIAEGKYRGPLHGIPYGLKDLLATEGIRTTWGSVPYRDQIIDKDATVARKLRDAGAVLVAKTTVGELAWGDVWYGGMTRNPWNYKQGSSGSSAGSASATAAGLVAFSIGTETWGSIVSPSTRCGTTGLRPSYGRVSLTGAMALSWSMDKIGPICRTIEDCALVFNVIYGPDGIDKTLYDVPFNYNPEINLREWKIGYLRTDFEKEKEDKDRKDEQETSTSKTNDLATLEKIRSLGVELIPLELPKLPVNDLGIILSAEAAAAFDEITRSKVVDMMRRQVKDAWPNVFRQSRFIPAVEYINANRIRHVLVQDMGELLQDIDVYVAPSVEGDNLLLTNLTGQPCVVVPNGFKSDGTPTSITFCGKLFDEAKVLAAAKVYQDATDFHLKHPTLQE